MDRKRSLQLIALAEQLKGMLAEIIFALMIIALGWGVSALIVKVLAQ